MVGLRLVAAPRLLRLRDREVRRRVPWIERIVGEGLRAVLSIGREGEAARRHARARDGSALARRPVVNLRVEEAAPHLGEGEAQPRPPRSATYHHLPQQVHRRRLGRRRRRPRRLRRKDSVRWLAEGGALALDGLGLRRRGVSVAEQRSVRAPQPQLLEGSGAAEVGVAEGDEQRRLAPRRPLHALRQQQHQAEEAVRCREPLGSPGTAGSVLLV